MRPTNPKPPGSSLSEFAELKRIEGLQEERYAFFTARQVKFSIRVFEETKELIKRTKTFFGRSRRKAS